MMSRLTTSINRARHRLSSHAVLSAHPVTAASGGPTVVSMLGASQVMMYLCAIKTFAQQISPGRVVVLDDGTLDTGVRRLIEDHVDGVRFVHVDEIEVGPVQRGNCWERLLLIADLARDGYVVQLDSDTLTLGSLPEVARCIKRAEAFTLITEAHWDYRSAAWYAERMRAIPGNHIQPVVERTLDRIPGADTLRYVRGCAAFAGFPQGTVSRPAIYDFSERMRAIVGERWLEWGTEQIASNWTVANTARIGCVPYPRYRNQDAHTLGQDTVFVHFIGTFRFASPVYARLTTKALSGIRPNGSGAPR